MRFWGIEKTAGGALVAALLAAGALWGVQLAARPQGAAARAFFEQGRDRFGDFRMPRVCAEWGYANDRQPRRDSCYPALGSLLVKPFPFKSGAWFAGLGALLWAAAFLALADGRKGLLPLAACLVSAPMVFALERGNPIVHAAAASLLFVAWHDAEARWKRGVAYVALAVAAALKIVPAVLGVLVLGRARRLDGGTGSWWRTCRGDGGVLAALGALLFFVPFVWCGGCEGFAQWLRNAAENASAYVHSGAWGAVAIGRTARSVMLHVDVTQPWPGLGLERLVNAALGLGCLAVAVRGLWTGRSAGTADPTSGRNGMADPTSGRNGMADPAGGRNGTADRGDVLMLVTAALLLVPGNMHFYSGVYLLPVFALRLREGMGWGEAACWFALLCPLQVPLGAGSLNRPLANLAFMALLGGTLVRTFRADFKEEVRG